RVIVDNKGTAICLPPPAAMTNCIDIEKKIADPVRFGFGTAAAISNCGFTVAEVAPVSNFEACYPAGKNFFTRTWNVLDCEKKKVAECTQRITVTNVSDFTVDFPDDVVVGCFGDLPSKDALKAQMLNPASFAAGLDGSIKNDGCGVIAIEIKDDTLMATNDLECMKILRRIKVIDWCQIQIQIMMKLTVTADCYGLPFMRGFSRQ
ncbi:MAG: hypothetical protein HC817_12195, partial [Saprospiraceae bacterium]|nr:hypothetical protein [Saprospiraceae bacterium]